MENHLETDIDYNLDDPCAKSGAYGLWLHVLYISVIEYLHANKFSSIAAESFLFDPENVFFDYVSECLGYEPDAMRERIRKSSKGGPGLGVFDLSHHEAIHEPHKDRNASQVI